MAYQKVPSAEDDALASEVAPAITEIENLPPSSRGRVLKVVGLVTLAASAAVYAEFSGSGEGSLMASFHKAGSDWYYDDDDKYGADSQDANVGYSCDIYDDDSYYTPDICGLYDSHTCFGGSSPCNGSYWCQEICGDYCDGGMGAICFFKSISNLRSTCKKVAKLRSGYSGTYDPANDKQVAVDPDEIMGSTDDWIQDNGCGRHTYCEDCWGYCSEQKMKHWLEEQYGASGGYSPAAMKYAVSNIIDTCDEYGFSTDTWE